MNKPMDVTPIVVTLPQNHNYRQNRRSEPLVWDERNAGVKFTRGWIYLLRIPDMVGVPRMAGLKFNTSSHRAAIRHYVIEAGRLAVYDIWQPAWFLLLGIKRFETD